MARRLKDNVLLPSGKWWAKGTLASEMGGQDSEAGSHLWVEDDGAAQDVSVPDSTPPEDDGGVIVTQPPSDSGSTVDLESTTTVEPTGEGYEPVAPSDDVPSPPPQGGPKGSAKAWHEYAAAVGVEVDAEAKRDDVIDAVKAAGKPVE